MKIIFLDIDGVLNSIKYHKSKKYRIYVQRVNLAITEFARSMEIDCKAVKVLNTIIKKTDAKIVVSSTWRKTGYEEVKGELLHVGLKGDIIDITPDLSTSDYYVRGNEIYKWIKEYQRRRSMIIWNYLILDDDSDMLYSQKDHFVHLNGEKGLLKEHIDQCVNILNKTV